MKTDKKKSVMDILVVDDDVDILQIVNNIQESGEKGKSS